jgi:membrane protein required for colicin V production
VAVRYGRQRHPQSPVARNLLAVNAFDFVVFAAALVAIVMGYQAGLLRSLATIAGYLAAAPMAVAIAPGLTTVVLGSAALSPDATSLVLCIVFLALGVAVSALLRFAVGEFVGPDIGFVDRVAGAGLGAARIGLVAVLVVVIFEVSFPPIACRHSLLSRSCVRISPRPDKKVCSPCLRTSRRTSIGSSESGVFEERVAYSLSLPRYCSRVAAWGSLGRRLLPHFQQGATTLST